MNNLEYVYELSKITRNNGLTIGNAFKNINLKMKGEM